MAASYLCHHINRKLNSPATDLGGGHWQRRTVDIQDFLSACNEVRGVPGRRIPVNGKKLRETQRILDVLKL